MLNQSLIRALVNVTYKAFRFYLKGRTSNRYSLPLIGSVRQRRGLISSLWIEGLLGL